MGAQGLSGSFNKMTKAVLKHWATNIQKWKCVNLLSFSSFQQDLWKRYKSLRSCFPDCSILRTLLGNKGWKGSFHLLSPLLSPYFHLTELPRERCNLGATLEDFASILNEKGTSRRKSFSVWKSNIVLLGWEDDSQIDWRHLDGTALFKIERKGLWWKKSVEKCIKWIWVLHSIIICQDCDKSGGTEANAAMIFEDVNSRPLELRGFRLYTLLYCILYR